MATAPDDREYLSGRLLVVAYAVFGGLCILPIFLVQVPPLGDYLNHLARMHILADYADSTELQRNYLISWLPAPYVGMDLIVPELSKLLGIYLAGKVFVAFVVLLFLGGTYAIHYALFRRHGLWPLFSLLFVYNFALSLGFITYLLGAALWLVGFGIWLRLENTDPRIRVLTSTLVGLAIYASHFLALLGYGIVIVSYEFAAWWSERPRRFGSLVRRACIAAPQFVVPFILVFIVPKGEGTVTYYGSFSDKLAALTSPTRFAGSSFDRLILIFAVLGLIVGVITHQLRIAPRMRLPLIALGAAALLMPDMLSGTWGMDYRFPPIFMMLVVASTRFIPRSRMVFGLVCAIAAALLVGHLTTIYLSWRPTVARYAEFRTAMPEIERGARLLVFADNSGGNAEVARFPADYWHISSMAVIERDVFLPFLIKQPMMSVQASEANRIIDTPHGDPLTLKQLRDGDDPAIAARIQGTHDNQGRRLYWGNWPQNFDYAIGVNVSDSTNLPRSLVPVHRGSFFTIYQVQR